MGSPQTLFRKKRSRKKKLMYDELTRGFFWGIGERKNPDNLRMKEVQISERLKPYRSDKAIVEANIKKQGH